jgi:hypothetical protein
MKISMKIARHRRTWIVLFPIVFSLYVLPAVAGMIECPKSIRVRHDIVAKGESWKPIPSETEHHLRAAGFSDGPADEKAFLKPDSSRKVKQARTVTWSFGKGGSDSVWLSCSYEGTSVSVTQKVEGRVTECRVSYEEIPNRPVPVKQIFCQ